MGNSRSANKRHKQSEKRRLRNKSVRSAVRTKIKAIQNLLVKEPETVDAKSVSEVNSLLDRAVQKGVYHKNTAARTKARLWRAVQNTLNSAKNAA